MQYDDDDLGATFRALREYNREQRAIRRDDGVAALDQLTAAGYQVEQITDYQFRVDGRLDLYPTRRRWHLHKGGNRRGGYGQEGVLAAVERIIGPPQKPGKGVQSAP